ncbi:MULTISPECIES: alpha/beta hydrolase [Roseovarius]|mgnify:FL=1|uniref:alpha/beta hydrolase n=1 Tax=Roseovarius TaxID=74030 RepID=UPI0030B8E05A
MRLTLVLACLSIGLAGCGERPVARVAPPSPAAQQQQIYVATQRNLREPGNSFGEKRPTKLNFVGMTVSVPPTHKIGQIEWPDDTPDANTDFVITESRHFATGAAMRNDLLRRRKPGENETVLFVHGYNNTLSDALYRFAQIKNDFGVTAPAALYSWPSAGDPRGYAYDRDSVLFARDDMEETLRLLSQGNDKVFILAHSMGAHLTMEVLRQAALRGDKRLLSRISGVALMSPDIDPDLFRKQADAIGTLPQPFVIFTSREDRALGLISFITGRKARLGRLDSAEQVKGLNVSLMDFTELGGEGSDPLKHSVAVTSPLAVGVVRGMIEQAGAGGSRFGDYMVLKATP